MNPTDDLDPRFRRGLTALLIAIAGWGVLDLVLDGPEAWRSYHVFVELGFIAMSLGAVLYLWRGWSGAHRALRASEADRTAVKLERDRWRVRADRFLRGLGEEIDAQFDRWSLSPKEREVALLLLKGCRHKEVASLLGSSERTVRQQAVSVYRKSGLAGRAELAAFFLEDLLLPADDS